uniref:Uncharacterized protein n=1 Tax=Manihot esculenta TaxID=3983 RepID=A0A2C9U905_MANES
MKIHRSIKAEGNLEKIVHQKDLIKLGTIFSFFFSKSKTKITIPSCICCGSSKKQECNGQNQRYII